MSVPSVCGQTARRAVGRLLTRPPSIGPWKAVPCRLAGVVEICRPVNNPPLRRNNASVKRAGAVTPRQPRLVLYNSRMSTYFQIRTSFGKCPSTVAVFCEFCFDYIRFLERRRPVQSRSNPLSVNQSRHPHGPHQRCTQRPQLTAIPAARHHTRARLPDTYKKKAACCE